MNDGLAPAPAISAPPAAPAPGPAPSAPAPAPPAPNELAWLGIENIPDETRGFIQNKGWKSGADAVSGYVNLEKLLGADRAGRTVVLPKDDAPAEDWATFYNKMGRPDAADKYDVPVPEGVDATFAKEAKAWFHEAGLNPKQAKTVAEKWNAYVQGRTAAQTAEMQATAQAAEGKLKSEWGTAFDQNVALAQKAAKAFGFSAAELDAMQSVSGYDGVFKRMHALATKIGEADFVSGNTQAVGGKLTPEQAKGEIAMLRKDSGFVAKYTSGDADAKRKMAELHQMAYPD